eukprot:2978525-Pleurochrysis_carterae.AAC.2
MAMLAAAKKWYAKHFVTDYRLPRQHASSRSRSTVLQLTKRARPSSRQSSRASANSRVDELIKHVLDEKLIDKITAAQTKEIPALSPIKAFRVQPQKPEKPHEVKPPDTKEPTEADPVGRKEDKGEAKAEFHPLSDSDGDEPTLDGMAKGTRKRGRPSRACARPRCAVERLGNGDKKEKTGKCGLGQKPGR